MVSLKKPRITGMASGKPNMRPADIPDSLDGGLGRMRKPTGGALPNVNVPNQMRAPRAMRGMAGKLPRRIK